MRSITWRSLLYGLAYVLFAIAAIFLALTFFAWFATEPGAEPLNALAGLAVSTLGAVLSLLNARKATDTRIGEYSPTSAQRARNRQAMIQRVRDSWIKGVLEQSLYQVARLELELGEQPAAVQHPWNLTRQGQENEPTALSHNVRISHVFDSLGQALLILGAPGAGKTTLLLELANDLLDRAEQDADHPIPVVFNLSSWTAQQKALEDWMVTELSERDSVPQEVARTWVEDETILPLLDGLDEVAEDHRGACAKAINVYRQKHGPVPIAVCSRAEEYERLAVHLRLHGAVAIDPLTREQVEAYLVGTGAALAGVRQVLAADATLYELLDTPLMLSVVTMVYKKESASGLQTTGTVEERRERLFAAYVEAMHKLPGRTVRYAQRQVDRWLTWLAWQMRAHDQSTFYLEQLQPSWLMTRTQKLLYPVFSLALAAGMPGLITGLGGGIVTAMAFSNASAGRALGASLGIAWMLIIGLALVQKVSLIISLIIGAAFGFAFGLPLREKPSLSLLIGVIIALSFGGTLWLLGRLLAHTQPQDSMEVQTVERLSWSWSGSVPGLALAGVAGFAIGLAFGRALWSPVELHFALGFGAAGTLLGGFLGSLGKGQVQTKSTPNQGIRQSSQNALLIGVLMALITGLPAGIATGLAWPNLPYYPPWIGLAMGTSVGLIVGTTLSLRFGGIASIRHYTLRALLVSSGHISTRYIRFLDYATERIFLRKVGGGYIFVHRLLQDYFAELWEREYAEAE